MANFKDLKLKGKAQAHILRKDTQADFKVSQGGLDAITANLLTSQSGLGRKLTAANARTLQHMQRTSARSRSSIARTINRGEGQVQNRYGAAVAANPNLFRMSDATARGSKFANKAALGGGKLLSKGANEAFGIIKQAGKTAGNAADFELATALRERQTTDAATIAASKLALAQQKEQEAANERYLRLQTQLATGGSGGEAWNAASSDFMAYAERNPGADFKSYVQNLGTQYNLGPAGMQKLRDMAANQGSASSEPFPEGAAFTEKYGSSPSAMLADDMEGALYQRAAAAYKQGDGVPDINKALSISGVTSSTDDKGNLVYLGADGKPVDEQLVEAAVTYIMSTFRRLGATS